MITALTGLVSTYGYGLVFGLILLESAGLPLPGETMLVIAAAYAANGHLSFVGVVLAAAIGAILGDMGGYWVGHRGGSVLLARISGEHYQKHMQKGHAFFAKYGPASVFLARFVPVVRVISANLAGMSGMRFKVFSLYNAAGGIAWAVLMGSLGFLFGNNLPLLDQFLQKLGIGLASIIAFLALAIWIARRLTQNEARVRKVRETLRQQLGLARLQHFAMEHLRFPKGHVVVILGGFLIAILAGWLFGAMSEDVLMKDSLTLYDVGIGKWFLAHATEDSNDFFFAVTQLGGTWAIIAGSLLLGGWLVWRKRFAGLVTLLASVGGGILLNVLLKNISLRPRPDFVNAFYHETGFSFPSGHSMMSVLFYGIAAYLLVSQLKTWKWKVWLATGAFTLSLLIGVSRLALGVHFLTDVLAGWSAGLTWLTVCIILYEITTSKPRENSII